ncbi:hypothetical protein DY000_02010529 [Brassica cretica]|uniref:Uncharacterized protein n=1 Tax=Brassica cretica TaxID=69181 RepID=A0ABQ7CG86_BRACR|nr:hypothetical protein DY000_02010529 [Brassica cretica]
MGIKLEAHECEQRITTNMIIRLKIGKTFESSFLESEQTQLDTGKTAPTSDGFNHGQKLRRHVQEWRDDEQI